MTIQGITQIGAERTCPTGLGEEDMDRDRLVEFENLPEGRSSVQNQKP